MPQIFWLHCVWFEFGLDLTSSYHHRFSKRHLSMIISQSVSLSSSRQYNFDALSCNSATASTATPLATLKRNCLWSFCLCTVKFIASKTKFVQVIAFICFCTSHSRFLAWVLRSEKKFGKKPKLWLRLNKKRTEQEMKKN